MAEYKPTPHSLLAAYQFVAHVPLTVGAIQKRLMKARDRGQIKVAGYRRLAGHPRALPVYRFAEAIVVLTAERPDKLPRPAEEMRQPRQCALDPSSEVEAAVRAGEFLRRYEDRRRALRLAQEPMPRSGRAA